MPSQSWLTAAPDASSKETLPVYSAACHAKKLSTILEVEEDDETRLGASAASASRPPYYSTVFSWELANYLKAECATMLPQALLVDASTTLCAYLYFTSLQARMAFQQQASLEILHTVCSAQQEPTASLFTLCSQAIAHQQVVHDVAMPGFISHRIVMLSVALKALIGFVVLKFGKNHVRPFDYLVASGAAHCLLLYCFLFLPIANLFEGIAITSELLWTRVMAKFFWFMIVCSALTALHCVCTSWKRQAIALPTDRDAKGMSEKDIEALSAFRA